MVPPRVVLVRCFCKGTKLRAAIRELDADSFDEIDMLVGLNQSDCTISLKFKYFVRHLSCLILNGVPGRSRFIINKHCLQVLLADNSAFYELAIVNPFLAERRSACYYLTIINENSHINVHTRISYQLFRE